MIMLGFPSSLRGLVRPWSSPVQRGRRDLIRQLENARRRDHWPTSPSARLYWWDWHPNFGDELGPWLLQRAGFNVARAHQDRASLAAVGSILEHLPDDYSGIIWGSGLTEGNPRRFENAHVAALRGHLTRDLLGVGEVPLGDPGLLVSDYLVTENGRDKRPGTATVRHFLHAEEPFSTVPLQESYSVDVTGTPDEVLGAISKAAQVLTSSLHGLVVADAFGVPAAWYRERGDSLVTSFKFQDYESVVTPGWSRRVELELVGETRAGEVFRRADLDSVRNAQADLRTSLQEVATRLPHKSPLRFALERRR